MRIYLTGIITILALEVSAINCPILNYIEQSEDAAMIFIGRVNNLTEKSVQFRIYETFKGSFQDEITVTVPPFFEKLNPDDYWLIYLYKSEGGELVLEVCGGAKNFKSPIAISNMYLLEPPPIDLDEKSYVFWMHINRLILLQNLQMELTYLGRKKLDWVSTRDIPSRISEPSVLILTLVLANLAMILLTIALVLKRKGILI